MFLRHGVWIEQTYNRECKICTTKVKIGYNVGFKCHCAISCPFCSNDQHYTYGVLFLLWFYISTECNYWKTVNYSNWTKNHLMTTKVKHRWSEECVFLQMSINHFYLWWFWCCKWSNRKYKSNSYHRMLTHITVIK